MRQPRYERIVTAAVSLRGDRARNAGFLISFRMTLLIGCLACSSLAVAAPSLTHTRSSGPWRRADLLSVSSQDPSAHREQTRPDISAYEAAERARQRYGGRVLNVVLEQGSSGPYYRVTLLDGGRVRVVHIDATH